MKKHLFFAACLATALFSACSNNEVEQLTSNEGTKVSFAINRDVARATTTVDNGTTTTTFAEDDEITVFSTGLVEDMKGEKFQVKGSTLKLKDETKSFTYNGNDGASFYACYPTTNEIENETETRTFTIQTDQSETNAYEQSDLMTANAIVNIAQAAAVQLEFKHKLTLVKVSLSGFTNITSVQLNNIKPTVKWTLSTDAVTLDDTSTPESITLNPVTVDQGSDTSSTEDDTIEYWAVVPAQTLDGGTAMFNIVANSKNYTYTPASDVTLTADTPIKFNLTLQPDAISVVLGSSLSSSWGNSASEVTENVEKMNYVMAPTSLSDLTNQGKGGLTTNGEWGKAFGTVSTKIGSGEATLNENKSISIKKTAAGHWSCNTIFYYGEAPKVNTGKQYLLTFNVSCDIANKQITVAMMTADQSGSFCAIKDGETYYAARLYKCVIENQTYQVSMVIDCTKTAGTSTTSATLVDVGEAKDQSYYLLFYPNDTNAMFTISNICLTEQ